MILCSVLFVLLYWNFCSRLATNDFWCYTYLCERFIYESYIHILNGFAESFIEPTSCRMLAFLFLYHYIEHAFALSTTIMYLLLSPPQFMFMDARLTASDCLCSVVEFMIALPLSNVNYLFSNFFTYLTFISKYRTILLLNKRWWFFGNRKIRYNR